MKITLVGNIWDVRVGKGLSRYLQEVYKWLSEKHEVNVVLRDEFAKRNYDKAVMKVLSKKYLNYVAEASEDSDVIHFTCPGSAPFKFSFDKPVVTTFHDLDPILYPHLMFKFPQSLI